MGKNGGGTAQVHVYFITEIFQAQVWSNEGTKVLQQNPLSTLVHTFMNINADLGYLDCVFHFTLKFVLQNLDYWKMQYVYYVTVYAACMCRI